MRVIVHIGSGNASSTAIQRTLRVNGPKSSHAPLRYFGVFPTNTPEPLTKFSDAKDQRKLQREGLHAQSSERALGRFAKPGFGTAIRSSEGLIAQARRFPPVLRRLRDIRESCIEIVFSIGQPDKLAEGVHLHHAIEQRRANRLIEPSLERIDGPRDRTSERHPHPSDVVFHEDLRRG